MKRVQAQPDVEVKVNPSCDMHYRGFRYGAGTELRLPFEEAIQKAKEGLVTLLVNPKEAIKEIEHGGA